MEGDRKFVAPRDFSFRSSLVGGFFFSLCYSMGNGESTCGLALVYLDKGEGVKKLIASFNSACQLWLEAILFICIFFYYFSPFFFYAGANKDGETLFSFPTCIFRTQGSYKE